MTPRWGASSVAGRSFASSNVPLRTRCPADITFTTPSGAVTYYDDFYVCDASDSKPYVKGIDEIIQAIDSHTR